MELTVIKLPTGALIPADGESADALTKVKSGKILRLKGSQPRNYKFHKRFFALLQVGFDAWEPPEQEYRGLPVQKCLDRFRKDLIVAAGYFDPVVNLKGEVRAEARSMSFGSMDQEEFEALYSAVCDVLLQRVMRNYTRDDLDQVVDQIIGFC